MISDRYFVRGKKDLCQLISRNTGVEGMPAGAEGSRISTASKESKQLGSPVEISLFPRKSSLAPLAEASSNLLTPNSTEESESPTVATVSISSTSSESGDAEVAMKEDPYRALLRKEHQFPSRLFEMLERSELDSFEHIVCWQPGDFSFKVHDPSLFVKSILPRFFRQTKYKSFQRVRISSDVGCWSY